MSLKNKIFLVLTFFFGFVAELIVLGWIANANAQAAESTAKPKIVLPTHGQAQEGSLQLISLSPLVADGETVGALAVYDDPTTRRSEDYRELYDSDGDLVAVGWFDRFGIQRIAVDRAFLEGREALQGEFVTVVDGEPI
jgi:hypothetical protein